MNLLCKLVLFAAFSAALSKGNDPETIEDLNNEETRHSTFLNVDIEATAKFQCQNKPSGYYADPRFDCKVFHFCHEDGRRVTIPCASESEKHNICIFKDITFNACEGSEIYLALPEDLQVKSSKDTTTSTINTATDFKLSNVIAFPTFSGNNHSTTPLSLEPEQTDKSNSLTDSKERESIFEVFKSILREIQAERNEQESVDTSRQANLSPSTFSRGSKFQASSIRRDDFSDALLSKDQKSDDEHTYLVEVYHKENEKLSENQNPHYKKSKRLFFSPKIEKKTPGTHPRRRKRMVAEAVEVSRPYAVIYAKVPDITTISNFRTANKDQIQTIGDVAFAPARVPADVPTVPIAIETRPSNTKNGKKRQNQDKLEVPFVAARVPADVPTVPITIETRRKKKSKSKKKSKNIPHTYFMEETPEEVKGIQETSEQRNVLFYLPEQTPSIGIQDVHVVDDRYRPAQNSDQIQQVASQQQNTNVQNPQSGLQQSFQNQIPSEGGNPLQLPNFPFQPPTYLSNSAPQPFYFGAQDLQQPGSFPAFGLQNQFVLQSQQPQVTQPESFQQPGALQSTSLRQPVSGQSHATGQSENPSQRRPGNGHDRQREATSTLRERQPNNIPSHSGRQIQNNSPQSNRQPQNISPQSVRQPQNISPQSSRQVQNVSPQHVRQAQGVSPQGRQPDRTPQSSVVQSGLSSPQAFRQQESIRPQTYSQPEFVLPQAFRQQENILPQTVRQSQNIQPHAIRQPDSIQPQTLRQLQNLQISPSLPFGQPESTLPQTIRQPQTNGPQHIQNNYSSAPQSGDHENRNQNIRERQPQHPQNVITQRFPGFDSSFLQNFPSFGSFSFDGPFARPGPHTFELLPSPQPQFVGQPNLPQQVPNQGRPREQVPSQGGPREQVPNQGRPREQVPNQGRPREQVPNQGRPREQVPNFETPQNQAIPPYLILDGPQNSIQYYQGNQNRIRQHIPETHQPTIDTPQSAVEYHPQTQDPNLIDGERANQDRSKASNGNSGPQILVTLPQPSRPPRNRGRPSEAPETSTRQPSRQRNREMSSQQQSSRRPQENTRLHERQPQQLSNYNHRRPTNQQYTPPTETVYRPDRPRDSSAGEIRKEVRQHRPTTVSIPDYRLQESPHSENTGDDQTVHRQRQPPRHRNRQYYYDNSGGQSQPELSTNGYTPTTPVPPHERTRQPEQHFTREAYPQHLAEINDEVRYENENFRPYYSYRTTESPRERPRTASSPYERPRTTASPYERPRTTASPYERPRTTASPYERSRTTASHYDRQRPTSPPYERSRPTASHYERQRPTSSPYERSRTTASHYERQRPTSSPYDRPRTSPSSYERPRTSPPSYERSRDSSPSYERSRDSPTPYERSRQSPSSYERSRESPSSYQRQRESRPSYERPRTPSPQSERLHTSASPYERSRTSVSPYETSRPSPSPYERPRTRPSAEREASQDGLPVTSRYFVTLPPRGRPTEETEHERRPHYYPPETYSEPHEERSRVRPHAQIERPPSDYVNAETLGEEEPRPQRPYSYRQQNRPSKENDVNVISTVEDSDYQPQTTSSESGRRPGYRGTASGERAQYNPDMERGFLPVSERPPREYSYATRSPESEFREGVRDNKYQDYNEEAPTTRLVTTPRPTKKRKPPPPRPTFPPFPTFPPPPRRIVTSPRPIVTEYPEQELTQTTEYVTEGPKPTPEPIQRNRYKSEVVAEISESKHAVTDNYLQTDTPETTTRRRTRKRRPKQRRPKPTTVTYYENAEDAVQVETKTQATTSKEATTRSTQSNYNRWRQETPAQRKSTTSAPSTEGPSSEPLAKSEEFGSRINLFGRPRTRKPAVFSPRSSTTTHAPTPSQRRSSRVPTVTRTRKPFAKRVKKPTTTETPDTTILIARSDENEDTLHYDSDINYLQELESATQLSVENMAEEIQTTEPYNDAVEATMETTTLISEDNLPSDSDGEYENFESTRSVLKKFQNRPRILKFGKPRLRTTEPPLDLNAAESKVQ